jgi:hypothetical protein
MLMADDKILLSSTPSQIDVKVPGELFGQACRFSLLLLCIHFRLAPSPAKAKHFGKVLLSWLNFEHRYKADSPLQSRRVYNTHPHPSIIKLVTEEKMFTALSHMQKI